MRKLVIWDFDGVIFNNPEKNYKEEFLKQLIVNGKNPQRFAKIPKNNSMNINVLFTGRSITQAVLIKELLKINGIEMRDFVFAKFDSHDYALNNFMDLYYQWKLDEMNGYFTIIFPKYQKILLDDDIKVINIMSNNKINVNLIHVPTWKQEWTYNDLITKNK